MGKEYQPLTEVARKLKTHLNPCISYAALVGELEEERRDILDLGFEEEQLLTEQIRELRREWERRRLYVAQLISETEELTSLERRVLRLRYLCAASWDGICLRVRRESGTVYSTYRRALNKLATHSTQKALEQ